MVANGKVKRNKEPAGNGGRVYHQDIPKSVALATRGKGIGSHASPWAWRGSGAGGFGSLWGGEAERRRAPAIFGRVELSLEFVTWGKLPR